MKELVIVFCILTAFAVGALVAAVTDKRLFERLISRRNRAAGAESRAKVERALTEKERKAEVRRKIEWENFMNYDGSEQPEIDESML